MAPTSPRGLVTPSVLAFSAMFAAALLPIPNALSAAPSLPVIPNGVFNVTSYGAVGNGTTTDTSAIQNTINAASAAGEEPY